MDLRCNHQQRRLALFHHPRWNGIDFLEVSDDQRSLCVHFFGQVPSQLRPAAVRIEGGRRIREIRVLEAVCAHQDDEERDDCLHITLDRYGDFSTYRLCLVDPDHPERPWPGLDPRYACLEFSFKTDCPSPFDCAPAPCAAGALTAPALDINYLAKDYDSFRRLLLERLALTMPDWRERHVPDLGVTLVELLAYSADMLSYYQDAVATEAYLETARRRISVRRHLRLLDYPLDEGCNARAWLTLDTDINRSLPADVYFVTGSTALAGLAAQAGGAAVAEHAVRALTAGQHQSYQPILPPGADTIALVAAHSRIAFYTWGDSECCLPAGACRATLRDDDPQHPGQRLLQLQPGDILVLEEVNSPHSGHPDDRDLSHRHAVRLTAVEPLQDELLGVLVVEISWASADALPFPLCLSTRLAAPACAPLDGLSVARGNVLLVEHGLLVQDALGPVASAGSVDECTCEGSIIDSATRALPFRPQLRHAPLVHSVAPSMLASASASLVPATGQAGPRIVLTEASNTANTSYNSNNSNPAWYPRSDLLHSGADQRDFVAEIDDDGVAWLRFGDGVCGRQPAAGTQFQASYLSGGGPAGNVAAEAIRYLVYRGAQVDGFGLSLRNPLPAVGGLAPETVAAARLNAPYAFRSVLQRAVTAGDYAALAECDPRIARANARLLWNGSWYEAYVALDPLGTERSSRALRRDIAGELQRYRRMGHDLRVLSARYVPLVLGLHVCVLPDYVLGHVRAALVEQLSNRQLADGSLGFFHPDRLSFGSVVAVSAIIGLLQPVAGVASVQVTLLYRDGQQPELAHDGLLKLAADEIAQLDNDRNFPEQGRITLTMDGGRG